MAKGLLWLAAAVVAARGTAFAQPLPVGRIVDDVQCDADQAQKYALYLPSSYTPSRKWPVIFGFDAGGRGIRAVERYQPAAEKYGYIVVGSNNSRNGPWDVSLNAAAAMTADVTKRFSIDPAREYAAGMSGGARVAMKIAMESNRFAGVLASSASFPDEFHDSVRFPVFGSMGTEDFNHFEMYLLDRFLMSPHRVEQFVGTHEWLPVELATDGVEWMEILAMKAGARPRDQQAIDAIFAKRTARADAQVSALDRMRELKSIAVDFQGLKDIGAIKTRADKMADDPDVKKQSKAEEAEEQHEEDVVTELDRLRNKMTLTNNVFATLKPRVLAVYEQSQSPADTSDRRVARRVLARFVSASRDIYHPQFQELLNQIRPTRPAGGPQ